VARFRHNVKLFFVQIAPGPIWAGKNTSRMPVLTIYSIAKGATQRPVTADQNP